MKLLCDSTPSTTALIMPMTMAFILVCSNSQGWLWPILGYAGLIASMSSQARMPCRRHFFWSIAGAGLLLLLLALTAKQRWLVIL